MRPRAMRPAAVPPAMSTCAMIQPPKMSPFWLASAGIGMTRSAGCLPSGSFSMGEIMQWAAAERGEAGAEDKAGIRQLRVGDDAFVDRALRFRQVGIDQLADELGPPGIGLALHRPAVLPAVDALAGLLAELAHADLARQDARHLGGLRQGLAGGEA